MNIARLYYILPGLLLLLFLSCRQKSTTPSAAAINELNLKQGALISCGSSDRQFGKVDFEISCTGKVKEDFNLGVELLHSFEYDEAEKVFAKIIKEEPDCAMAYWGVAMSNFHPLWTPPSEAELKKGAAAIFIAQSILPKTAREESYIEAIAAFYNNWDKADHHTRCIEFEKKMKAVHIQFPADKEAAIFYALSLDAAADPADKSYAKQKEAGAILNALYPEELNHPGIIHYIIHTYDYPGLAIQALPAARKYAAIAPSSAHALHMPSHIFTRLGFWDECIQSNLASVAAAQCYAQTAGIKGHWDEELHGMDYLVYAYLQKGNNDAAKKQLDYLEIIKEINPANFKVAYAFAAIPARYVLENKLWKDAAALPLLNANFSWENFLWQKAIVDFARLLGAVHIGSLNSAKASLKELNRIHDSLIKQKDAYKANQVQIQIKMGEAWIQLATDNHEEALTLMNTAANMEDSTEKHPVTPGEVIPARELLGDMLLKLKQYDQALQAYEADLQKHPNRFNGLYGAGLAAQQSGNRAKASLYHQQLLALVKDTHSNRSEIVMIKQISEKH